MQMNGFMNDRVWADINLDAVDHNYQLVKKQINSKTKICCVIKANAYGHSAVELAREYEQLGADYFAVANIEEAVELRKADIKTPILILGYTPLTYLEELAEFQITQCIYSYEYGKQISALAQQKGVKIKSHIKLDTGMGRIGFRCCGSKYDDLEDAYKTCCLDNLEVEGVFTHFSVADDGVKGKDYTKFQFKNFIKSIEYLNQKGITFKIRHCSNSAGIFDYPEYQLDMVRAGIVLYGLKPSETILAPLDLQPVMTLKACISNVKEVFSGDCIGYGRAFEAKEKMRIATLSVGYADGVWRNNYKTPLKVIVNQQETNTVGKICMDQLMIDVTNIECGVGDAVILFGDYGLSADEIAKNNNTINYEIVCAIGQRVRRNFVRKNTNYIKEDVYGNV